MKNIFFAALVITASACSNETTSDTELNMSEEVMIEQNNEIVETSQIFGDSSITEDGAITGDELIKILETNDSVQVKVIAEISEVCSKKGCWMQVNLDENNSMLVRFLDYGFFMPLDAAGRTAIIEGLAKIDTLSIEWLKHQLEDASASQEEIDAITEPEISYTIEEATGVILK